MAGIDDPGDNDPGNKPKFDWFVCAKLLRKYVLLTCLQGYKPGLNKEESERFKRESKEILSKITSDEIQELKRELKEYENFRKLLYRINERDNKRFGLIYKFSDIKKCLQIEDLETFKGWGWNLYIWETPNGILFTDKTLYEAISEHSYKYINGERIEHIKYHRLPEYYKVKQCAEILGLKGQQFKRNYIKNNPDRLEGVEILENGSTVRIEKKSFDLWIKSDGKKWIEREKAKLEGKKKK